MNHPIIEQELVGKTEDGLLLLVDTVATELAALPVNQPTYQITEASLETLKSVITQARNRAASRHRMMAR